MRFLQKKMIHNVSYNKAFLAIGDRKEGQFDSCKVCIFCLLHTLAKAIGDYLHLTNGFYEYNC